METLFPSPCVWALSSQRPPEQGSHGEVGREVSAHWAQQLIPEN